MISLVHGTRISNEAVSIPNMTARGRARMKYGAFVHLKMCPKQSPDERQQASDPCPRGPTPLLELAFGVVEATAAVAHPCTACRVGTNFSGR